MDNPNHENSAENEEVNFTAEQKDNLDTSYPDTFVSPVTDNTKLFGKGAKLFSIINIEPRGVTVFFRQLATLIGAGVPILKALRTIAKSGERGVGYVVNSIANDVEHGESLSIALSRFPNIFSKIYINLIIVAERGGSLEETLRGIANLVESEDRTRVQIKRALLYPAVTLFIAIGVLAFVLAYVIPQFVAAMLGTAENLPFITKVLLNVSDFFNAYWWGLLLGSIVIGYSIRRLSKSASGRRFLDAFILKVPVLGVIFKKILTMNFCRSFGMLIKNGVPALQALRLMQETTENRVFAEIFRKTCESVEHGSNISEPLAESRMFSPFVIDLITTGESSGQLDNMMIKVADAYHDEVEQITQNLGTLIEPILLLVIGSFVSLIVFSVFSTYVQTLKMLS